MSASDDLKAKLEAFVLEQQAALTALDARTAVERARLTAQIAAAEAVLSKWTNKVDTTELIDALALVGGL